MNRDMLSYHCFNTIREMNAIFKHEVMVDLAHQVNQHLSATVSYIDGCVNHLHKKTIDQHVMAALKQASEQIACAGQLIHALKTGYRNNIKQSNYEPVNITLLVKHILSELASELAKSAIKVMFNNKSKVYFSGYKVQLAYALWTIIDSVRHRLQQMEPLGRLLHVSIYQEPDNIIIDIGNIDANVVTKYNKQAFTAVLTAKLTQKALIELNVVEHILTVHKGKLFIKQTDRMILFRMQLPVQRDE